MHFEYLRNNDTENITRRVRVLAENDESALRRHCREASALTDASLVRLGEEFAAKRETLAQSAYAIGKALRNLMQTLSANAGVFRTQNARTEFPAVCCTVTFIGDEKMRLLQGIDHLAQVRRSLYHSVAETNQALHFVTEAQSAVDDGSRAQYADALQQIRAAYQRLTELDTELQRVQNVYMILLEKQLPAFLERLQVAADFSHAGAMLDRAAVRSLCSELLLGLGRLEGVTF